jgi:hypothetical protein
MNKITCMQGSSYGKACMACIKAKQCCGGFLGKEKQAVTEPVVLREVMMVPQDIIKVLRGIWLGMRGLEKAINGYWASVESDEDESEEEEAEDVELIEELVGLLEEAMDYCTFWRVKYGGEYRAMVLRKNRKNMEEEMRKGKGGEKEKELKGDEGNEMEVDEMVMGLLGSVA